jgi:hypothetical protein
MLLHFPVHNGIPVVVQSRFDPVSFCANIELYKVTAALVVPPVLVVLSRHEGARCIIRFSPDLQFIKQPLSGMI